MTLKQLQNKIAELLSAGVPEDTPVLREDNGGGYEKAWGIIVDKACGRDTQKNAFYHEKDKQAFTAVIVGDGV